jgi:multidrug resistance efflux pump
MGESMTSEMAIVGALHRIESAVSTQAQAQNDARAAQGERIRAVEATTTGLTTGHQDHERRLRSLEDEIATARADLKRWGMIVTAGVMGLLGVGAWVATKEPVQPVGRVESVGAP